MCEIQLSSRVASVFVLARLVLWQMSVMRNTLFGAGDVNHVILGSVVQGRKQAW